MVAARVDTISAARIRLPRCRLLVADQPAGRVRARNGSRWTHKERCVKCNGFSRRIAGWCKDYSWKRPENTQTSGRLNLESEVSESRDILRNSVGPMCIPCNADSGVRQRLRPVGVLGRANRHNDTTHPFTRARLTPLGNTGKKTWAKRRWRVTRKWRVGKKRT